jgi:hypothetical protein
MGGDPLFRGDLVVIWETPTLRASSFAGLASDAEGTVVEDGFRHIKTLNSVLTEFNLFV